MGTRLMDRPRVLETGPIDGLREVFCFPFLFGIEARDTSDDISPKTLPERSLG